MTTKVKSDLATAEQKNKIEVHNECAEEEQAERNPSNKKFTKEDCIS